MIRRSLWFCIFHLAIDLAAASCCCSFPVATEGRTSDRKLYTCRDVHVVSGTSSLVHTTHEPSLHRINLSALAFALDTVRTLINQYSNRLHQTAEIPTLHLPSISSFVSVRKRSTSHRS